MSTLLSPIKTLAGNVGGFFSKRRDMHLLLALDDRTLTDINISRELLEQGVKSWPWLMPQDSVAVTSAASGIRAAVKELDSYSDSELADLGISRGDIVNAVLHGRPGIERPLNDNGYAKAA